MVHYPPPKDADEDPVDSDEEEEGKQPKVEEELPPRSMPRAPLTLCKLFHHMTHGLCKMRNGKDFEELMEQMIEEIIKYVATDKFLIRNELDRLSLPNIQIMA